MAFYQNYHGHTISSLNHLISKLKLHCSGKSFIYLAGDSSLDNKYWLDFNELYPFRNGYEKVFNSGMVKDVSFLINSILEDENIPFISINCAIEESTLSDRITDLPEQDKFILNNISTDDILILSCGGNDIALRPTFSTIMNMLWLSKISWINSIENGNAWGLGHLIDLFTVQIYNYLEKLISQNKPKLVLLCMIYYPDENSEQETWANRSLGLLGYDNDPSRVQSIINTIYREMCRVIEKWELGVKIIPVPLFKILNSKDTNDYIERVEPSQVGGQKMARTFVDIIKMNCK